MDLNGLRLVNWILGGGWLQTIQKILKALGKINSTVESSPIVYSPVVFSPVEFSLVEFSPVEFCPAKISPT